MSIAKGLKFGFEVKFPLHLYVLVEPPQTPRKVHAKAVEKDFLDFVRLGDATETDCAVVLSLLRLGGQDYIAAFDLAGLRKCRLIVFFVIGALEAQGYVGKIGWLF